MIFSASGVIRVDKKEQDSRGQELHTWQEIARFLNISVRTAQDLEKRRGLPVYRLKESDKSRVWAFGGELLAWRAGREILQAAPAAEQHEPAVPESPISLPPAAEPAARRSYWTGKRLGVVAGGLLLLLTGLVIVVKAIHPPERVAKAVVHGNTLTAYDELDRQIWTHVYAGGLLAPAYEEDVHFSKWGVGDLDRDGIPELIFKVIPTDVISRGSSAECFSSDGRSLWKYANQRRVAYRTPLEPLYFVNNVGMIHGAGEKGADLAMVSSNHHLGAPNQVALLDHDGRIVKEYWHSGHLLSYAEADLNGDRRNEIVLGGVNNGLAQATVVVLDTNKMDGVSQNHGEEPQLQVPGLTAASEKYVVLLPRTCFLKFKSHNLVNHVKVTPERVVAAAIEGAHESVSEGEMIYEFDYQMNLVNMLPNITLRAAHERLEKEGAVDHTFDSELAQMRKQVVRIAR